MNGIKNILATISVGVFVVGCATSGPSKKKSQPTKYTKAVSSKSIVKLRSKVSCPKKLVLKSEMKWKAKIALANACAKAQNWRHVETLGNHLASTEYLSPWGVYFLSLSSLERKQFKRSQWMIEAALKKAPSVGLFYYQRGRVLWAMGEVDSAVASMEESLRLDSNNIEAHLLLGQVYLKDLEFKRAAKHFEIVKNERSRDPVVLDGLAYCYQKMGKDQQALKLLEVAINKKPRSLDFRIRQAHILESKIKDEEKALGVYRRIRYLYGKKRLDGRLNINIDDKIKNLEVSVNKKRDTTQKKVTLVTSEGAKGEVTK